MKPTPTRRLAQRDLRFRAVGVVAFLALLSGLCAACSSSPHAKPATHSDTTTVSRYSISPSVLSAAGGTVAIDWTATGGNNCKLIFSPSPSKQTNERTCSDGSYTSRIKVPANEGDSIKRYKIVVAVQGASQSAYSLPMYLQLAAPTPVVSSFTATPSSLGSGGGTVQLRATVAHAGTCQVEVNPHVKGFKPHVKCKSGKVDESLTLPANKNGKTKKYVFKLDAIGGLEGMPTPIPTGSAPGKKTKTKTKTSTTTSTTTRPPASSTTTSSPASTTTSPPSSTTSTTTAKTKTPKHQIVKKVHLSTEKETSVTVGAKTTPAITGFTSSSSSLPDSGGSLTLSVSLASGAPGAECKFAGAGKGVVTNLPYSASCASGSASVNVTVASNPKHAARVIHFTVTVHVPGTKALHRKISVTEAASPKSSGKASTTTTTKPSASTTAYVVVTGGARSSAGRSRPAPGRVLLARVS